MIFDRLEFLRVSFIYRPSGRQPRVTKPTLSERTAFLSRILGSVLMLLPLSLCPSCGRAPDDKDQRPNIVFIIADDLSWEHLGAYGSTEVRTPNIDRLAQEGIVFSNSFVSTPSCTPSRASILTGRNGFELGQGASLWGYLPEDYPLYTELLEAEGYEVGATGKGWGPGFLMDRSENPAGRIYSDIEAQPYDSLFDRTEVSRVDYAANFSAFIQDVGERPFCFWLGTYEPHRGYTRGLAESQGRPDPGSIRVPDFLPDALPVQEDLNEYMFEVEHIDRHVGEVVEVLRKRDKLDNTIILFTSDNGMPFPRAKATLYDHGTRMPLIFWWGDNIEGGRTIGDMISHTDIAPTFLELAGAEVPEQMSGKSFLPQVLSDKNDGIDAGRDRVYLYRERHAWCCEGGGTFASRAVRTKDYLFIWNADPDVEPADVDGGPTRKTLTENRERYPRLYDLTFGKRPEFELYDVKSDPYQMDNLIEDEAYAQIAETLREDLFGYLRAREDPRMLGNQDVFKYTPYFGHLFELGILNWAQDRDGRRFSEEEIAELLDEAYRLKGESEAFRRVAESENWKVRAKE
jgi:uncharacterized sulfatase